MEGYDAKEKGFQVKQSLKGLNKRLQGQAKGREAKQEAIKPKKGCEVKHVDVWLKKRL